MNIEDPMDASQEDVPSNTEDSDIDIDGRKSNKRQSNGMIENWERETEEKRKGIRRDMKNEKKKDE